MVFNRLREYVVLNELWASVVKRSNTPHFTKYAAIFLAAITLYLGAQALQWGWADMQAQSVRHLMKKWQSDLAINEPAEWARAHDRMRTAYKLHPTNAEYAADMGRLHEWKALQYEKWQVPAKQHRTEAINYFRQAVSLRPAWGFMWAHYAQSKLLNQQLDSDTLLALDKAMVLAPWEIKVQQKVIWLGMNLWPNINDEMKHAIDGTIHRAIELQPIETLQLLLSWPMYPEQLVITKQHGINRALGKNVHHTLQLLVQHNQEHLLDVNRLPEKYQQYLERLVTKRKNR